MALVFNGSNNTIGGLAVGGLPDGTVDADLLASSVTTGKILQVQSAELTSVYEQTSVTGGTYYDVLTCDIQPASSSNKILIQYHLGQVVAFGGTDKIGMQLRRGTTNIAQGDAAGSRNRYTIDVQAWDIQQASRTKNLSGFWIDSPSSTSSITYRVSFIDQNGDGKFCIGRSEDDSDDSVHARTPSQLILMEVSA